ncbi:MAG TPA: RNA polymerase sigma factor [Polyangia bacterium]|nr:RNA polymerase sigma factor [Polyangia bacterium]
MSAHALTPPAPDGADDVALVTAAQRGETEAKERLFRKYGLMVNGLCFRLLGSDQDLDDLVQECFLQMFRSLHRLDKPQAFRGWLSEIVVRTTHNLIRRRRLMVRFGLRTTSPVNVEGLISPGAPPDAVYALNAIYKIIASLPPRVRVALVLRRVEGRPLGEVAQLMGASLASVKRWLVAADKALATERRGAEGGGGE